jgi:hypothetical protein
MTENCLICLDSVNVAADCVMSCPSGHFMHARCMVAMLVKMGSDKCPYCLKPVPFVITNRRSLSLLARGGILLEHGLYELMLLMLLFFSTDRFPAVWRMNRHVSFLRLRYNYLDGHLDSVRLLREWAIVVILSVQLAVVIATGEWILSCMFGYGVDALALALYCGIAVGSGRLDG